VSQTSPDPSLPGVDGLHIPRREPVAGDLLLAGPLLTEPTFAGSVIALLEHDENGSLGVILNQPSVVAVAAVLPEWGSVVSGEPVLFHGGPVGLDSALAVGVATSGPASVAPSLMRTVAPGWGLVDLDSDLDEVRAHMAAVRIYAGYSGWSAGQLAAEVHEGSWFVIECTDPIADLCSVESQVLWSRLAGRQHSDLRLLSHRPADPSDN
jgi:putative transcriptional regulator